MKVYSGGQSGADLGGLLAARDCSIATGGYAPAGWRTEFGPRPHLADFGLREHASEDYRQRTISNVHEAGLIALFYGELKDHSPGTRLTRLLASEHGIECFEVEFVRAGGELRTGHLGSWSLRDTIRRVRPDILLVAGNRESVFPGIGAAVRHFLVDVFRSLETGL